jgi:hypothetical protein
VENCYKTLINKVYLDVRMRDEKLPPATLAGQSKYSPTYKDYSPGTFTVKSFDGKKNITYPFANISKIPNLSNVGKEVINKKKKELEEVGRLAEEVGIEITETSDGLQVVIPPELIEQEVEKRGEKEKRNSTLLEKKQKELIPLYVRRALAKNELQRLDTSALTPEIQQELIGLLDSIEKLFSLDTEERLVDLDKELNRLEELVREAADAEKIRLDAKKIEEVKNEKTKAKEQELLEKEKLEKESQALFSGALSLWPPYIYFEKPKNGKGGWFLRLDGKTTELQDTKAWTEVEADTKPIFAEYFKFISDTNSKTRARKIEKFRDLILAKNDVVSALIDGDLEKVAVLRETLRTLIEESKELWHKVLEGDKKAEAERIKREEIFEGFKKMQKLFAEQKAIADSLITTQEISTEDGRKALISFKDRVATLEEELKSAFEKGEPIDEYNYATFTTHLESFTQVIAQAIKRLNKIHTTGNTVLRSSLNLKNKRGKVHKRDGTIVSVEAWIKEQEEMAKKKSQESRIRQSKTETELLGAHKDSFTRNREAYKALYVNKNFSAEDTMNEAAKDFVLSDEITSLEKGVEQLTKERGMLDASLDNANSPEELQSTVKKLERTNGLIRRVDEEINSLKDNETIKAEAARLQKNAEKEHLTMLRETYSPEHDDSLAYIPIAGKEYSLLKNWKEASRRRVAEGHRKREASHLDAENLTQEEVRALKPEVVTLTERLHPNHTDGMTRSLTEDQARHTEGAYFVNEHAQNNTQEPTPLREQLSESLTLRLKKVAKIIESFEGRYGKDWRKYAVPAALVVAAAALYTNKDNQPVSTQSVEVQTPRIENWKTIFKKKESLDFLKDFIGQKEINFSDLIKKYAPNVPVNTMNPASLVTLSTWKTGELLGDNPTISGLTNEQRKELCDIIKNLEEIGEGAELYLKKSADQGLTTYKSSDYKRIGTDVTILDFYESVRQAARQAELLANK